MADFTNLFAAVDATANGEIDQTGKTPLDDALERIHLTSSNEKAELASALQTQFPAWSRKSERFLKLGRQIVRRTALDNQPLARTLQQLLSRPPIATDSGRRLWISLTLMDLGFPRTVAALEDDRSLRSSHIGEWLTLVAANQDYAAVCRAFTDAARENLISVSQLSSKGGGGTPKIWRKAPRLPCENHDGIQ